MCARVLRRYTIRGGGSSSVAPLGRSILCAKSASAVVLSDQRPAWITLSRGRFVERRSFMTARTFSRYATSATTRKDSVIKRRYKNGERCIQGNSRTMARHPGILALSDQLWRPRVFAGKQSRNERTDQWVSVSFGASLSRRWRSCQEKIHTSTCCGGFCSEDRKVYGRRPYQRGQARQSCL